MGDKYRLESMVGTGGMGAVWAAGVEGNDGERVAVKFLHAQMASDPLIVQRFLLEARAGLEIRHPNVVPVITQGWIEASDGGDNTPWFAMEYLNGKSLADTLKLRGRIDAVDALAIVAYVTSGVAAAHAKGIVHRDIKPANVFLQVTEDGVTPKLLDFGISKYVDPGMDAGLTSTGAIVGSAMYMSPEQAAGGYNVDKRSDVWSLGIMLYRMLTGESPFPANVHQDIMVLLGSPKELDLGALKHPRIPVGAAEVVRRCLRKKREERYASASELEPEVRRILDNEIESSHAPNIDSLLRPASSRATFIAAPLDASDEPEVTMPTAPTGVVASVVSVVPVVPVVTQTTMPSGPPPAAFVGPPTPRSTAPPSAPMLARPTRHRPRGTPVWAKAGAIAFGIGIVGFGGFAYRYTAHPHAEGTVATGAPEAIPAATSAEAALAAPPRDLEIVEVPTETASDAGVAVNAPPNATSSRPAHTTGPRVRPTLRPPPPPPPKPATNGTRTPGF